jgi:glycosyltransferase involved in cell wall biosynthesis
MNIVHVIPGITHERGGPPAVLQALVRHQADAGHSVTVLTTDQGQRRGEGPVELDRRVRVARGSVWGPDRIAYAPAFPALLRRHLRGADVCHVHSVFTYPVHAALREARGLGVPVVLRPCGVLHRLRLGRSRLQKRAYLALWGSLLRRCCTAWHYTSADEAAHSWPWDASPRFVLGLGLDPERFAIDREQARRDVARHWPQLGDDPYVLFLGRLHPQKRPDLLASAFAQGAPPGFKLVLAGPDEGGLRTPLAREVLRDPATASRILALGTVTGTAKLALLAGARLFALPSEHENFGLAVLEALGSGTPVLATPQVDVAREAAGAGVAEVLPPEVSLWRDRLAALLGQPTVQPSFVTAARRWVERRHSWRRLAARLLDYYAWARGGCRGPLPKADSEPQRGGAPPEDDSVPPASRLLTAPSTRPSLP